MSDALRLVLVIIVAGIYGDYIEEKADRQRRALIEREAAKASDAHLGTDHAIGARK